VDVVRRLVVPVGGVVGFVCGLPRCGADVPVLVAAWAVLQCCVKVQSDDYAGGVSHGAVSGHTHKSDPFHPGLLWPDHEERARQHRAHW